MTMNTLQEYADIFERLQLTELSVEDGEQKLTLRRDAATCVGNPMTQACMPVMPQMPMMSQMAMQQMPQLSQQSTVTEDASTQAQDAPKPERKGEAVLAPLLGIFHARSSGAALAVGDTVRKGEALCTIEAMKMMNEVTAPRDGVITEVCASEGALVEYHRELFILE